MHRLFFVWFWRELDAKGRNFYDFFQKTCLFDKFFVTLQPNWMQRCYARTKRVHVCAPEAHKERKKHYMEAVRERGISYEPIIGNYEHEVYYTHEEFMNELAKQLGQAYGLNDIREAC